jgi:hypothetical protein
VARGLFLFQVTRKAFTEKANPEKEGWKESTPNEKRTAKIHGHLRIDFHHFGERGHFLRRRQRAMSATRQLV